jgi:hypothetical protein
MERLGDVKARRETLALKDPYVLHGVWASQLGTDGHEGRKGQDDNLKQGPVQVHCVLHNHIL